MYKYLLIQKIYDGDRYHNPEVVGTFDNIAAANRFIESSPDYPDNIKFISCRQLIEYPFKDTHYQLDLTSVPYNPVHRIGELRRLIEDEPSIEDFMNDPAYQESFVEHRFSGLSIHPYFTKHDTLDLQFWGWCITLNKDGTWFWQDTSGG